MRNVPTGFRKKERERDDQSIVYKLFLEASGKKNEKAKRFQFGLSHVNFQRSNPQK